MNVFTTVLPFLSSAVSLIFALLVLRRFGRKRGAHHCIVGDWHAFLCHRRLL